MGKLFIGGISWETSEEKLKNYFMAYGEVTETVIMKDRATGRARGFGFVVFADPVVADRVVQEKHTIDGRIVEAKKAVPRDEQQSTPRTNNGGLGPANHTRTKKIFVGGLASTVTEIDFRKYFEQFGTITDVVVMYDHSTQRPRGFGFITYDNEDAVDRVLQKSFHELKEKMVEVKRAIPKDFSAVPFRNNGAGHSVGLRGGPYGGGNGQNFIASPAGLYGGRMDSRYGSSQGGGYSPYGTAGYGSNGNFGATLNSGYNGSPYGGGSGNYSGGSFGGASNAGVIYGRSGGGYGGSASASGYGSSTPGRNVWSSRAIGYGSGSPAGAYGGSGSSGFSAYGGTGTWGSAQSTSISDFGYGSSDSAFGSSNAGYANRSNGYGSSLGGYISVEGSGSGTGAYNSSYRDLYGNIGYGERTRKAAGADTFDLASVRSGGLGSGVYNLGGSISEVAADGYSAGYAAGRPSHRGVPA